MAKASFSAKDAVAVNLGIQEGNVEIVAAICKIHQYPPNKNTGEQGEPFPCVQIEFQQYDSKWNKMDEEPVKMEFGIGKMDKFHPGLATGPDDDEPADQGDEVDVEGNCIAVVSDGAKLNKKSKWIILTTSMEEKGFKPEVLGNGYLPDLVGTRGHVKSIAQERMPNSTAKNDPTALVFDRIDVFPYEAKSKKPAAPAGKPATKSAAPAAKPTGKPATPPPPAANTSSASGSDDDEVTARSVIAEVQAEMSGEEPVTLEIKALKSKTTAKLMRNKIAVNRHKGINALIGDPAWLEEQANAEAGFYFDAEAGTVIFPAKED